jgi:hypothetical protein
VDHKANWGRKKILPMRRGSWHGGNGISILQLDLMSSCWWSFCNSKNVSTKKFWALLEHSISEDNILEDSTHDHKYVEQGNLEPIPLPSLCHPFAQDKKHKFTDQIHRLQKRNAREDQGIPATVVHSESAVTTYNTRRRTSREHYKKIWREKGVCCCEPHKTLNLCSAKSLSTVSILEKLKSDGSNDVNPITHFLMFGELRLRCRV